MVKMGVECKVLVGKSERSLKRRGQTTDNDKKNIKRDKVWGRGLRTGSRGELLWAQHLIFWFQEK
jgi:hypothetical protein